jgi:hypothetical protein
MMRKIESTVVVTDIRNFTGVCNLFEKRGNDMFMKFMEKYYEYHMLLAKEISTASVYVSTTGDGIISIFMGENHAQEGYTYALSMYRILTEICKKFSQDSGVELSFGIGADSGNIRKIDITKRDISINTYLGPVINRTSRIESLTKDYHYTNMTIGGNLYKALMRIIYPEDTLMYEGSDNYDDLIEEKPEMVLRSKRLLVYYIFENVLKGVDEPLPIFRLAGKLANNNRAFWRTIITLVGIDKAKKIKNLDK